MTDIIANPEWKAVRILEREEVALGGLGGNMNEQATSLVARTELLKNDLEAKADLTYVNSIVATASEGTIPFQTEAELLLATPTQLKVLAKALDTRKEWLWNRTSPEGVEPVTGNWTDTGLSDVDRAKEYTLELTRLPENFPQSGSYREGDKIATAPLTYMFYQRVKVIVGESYLVRSVGINISKPWYVVDGDGNIISESLGFNAVSDDIVKIPIGAEYLYANSPDSEASNFKLERLSDYDLEVISLGGVYPKQNQIAYISNNETPEKVVRVGSESVVSIVVNDVSFGEVFKVDAKRLGIVKAYYFVTEDFTVVLSENLDEPNLKVLTVPQYATKLIVCSDITYENFSVLKANYFSALAYEELEDLNIKVEDLDGGYPVQLEYAYIPDSSDPTKIKKVYSPEVKSIVVDVIENTLVKIDAKKVGIVKSYYFVDDVGTIISSEGLDEPNLKVVKVPVLATKLISCSDITYENFSVLKADYFGELAYEVSIGGATNAKQKIIAKYPQQPNYRHLLQEKCPKFYNKLRNKTDDLTVCITGTSLTQGNLYATTRSDATTRPPLLHTNDLSSHIFDSLIGYWHGQQYRRYDHTDLNYSLSDWSVKIRLLDGGVDIWDDFDYQKNGLTNTTTSANASVSTAIPVGAWQFNFIYRTDSQCGNCTVSIAEGNSKVEVFNGVNWVEANGFVFSMLESAVTETKGNTCYQKRLKMRCKNKASGGIDSLTTAKNITISKGNNANRFNVVGFEWSPREYMFTFVNSARGSHAWGLTDSPSNLEYYQDLDIWEFNPDLILCEVTSINWGAGFGQALNADPNYYVNIAKKAYFEDLGADWTTSLYNTSQQYTRCEIIFYGDTVATSVDYDMLWDANKQPKFGLVTTPAYNGSASTENVGRVKTIFENYEEIEVYVASKPYIFIPVSHQFKQLAYSAFGNYPDAFAPTLANGDSLSFDRVHLNDNGALFYAYLIKPLFANL